jgi:hypothetical protein
MTEVLLIFFGGMWVISYLHSLFINYTFGFKKEEYFPTLIRGFRNSSLRSLWKWLYLGITYTIGIIILGWYKSGEIPAIWTKRTLHYIFFTRES